MVVASKKNEKAIEIWSKEEIQTGLPSLLITCIMPRKNMNLPYSIRTVQIAVFERKFRIAPSRLVHPFELSECSWVEKFNGKNVEK